MDSVLIRRLEPDDLPAVLHLEILCFSDPWSRDGLRAALAEEYGRWYGAFSENKLVGMLGTQVLEPEAEILSVAAHPNHRRKGIAKALLARFFEENPGLSSVFLEVRRSNLPAQALYASFGFAVYGERKNYYGRPVEDAVLMSRTQAAEESC